MVGLLPLAAVTTLGPETLARLPDFAARAALVRRAQAELRATSSRTCTCAATPSGRLLSIVDADRLRRILDGMLDERRVPLAARPAGRCRAATATTRSDSSSAA